MEGTSTGDTSFDLAATKGKVLCSYFLSSDKARAENTIRPAQKLLKSSVSRANPQCKGEIHALT